MLREKRLPLFKGDIVDYIDNGRKKRGVISSNNTCVHYSTAFQVVPYELINGSYIINPGMEKLIDRSQIIHRLSQLNDFNTREMELTILNHHLKDGEKYKRGEVYFANLPKGSGSVQSGQRPVLVVSGEEVDGCIHVIPFSTKLKKKTLPTHLLVDAENSILLKDSVLLAEAEMLLPTKCLVGKLGSLDSEFMQKVLNCIKVQHGIIA